VIQQAIESCCLFVCNHWLIGWVGAIAMAYVPGFKWDIFLSYPVEAELWTKQFDKDLRDEPLLAAAKELNVYFARRDWHLGGSSDDMLEAAQTSAIFVAVLTKDAVDERVERFLRKEMEAFRESSPLKGRFCPISLYPIDASKLSSVMPIDNPEVFWNMNVKFFFHDDGIPILLRPDTELEPGLYKRTVNKVAHQLRERLDEIKMGMNKGLTGRSLFSGKTVFLAGTVPKSYVEEEREVVRKLLVNDGATVVPNETAENDEAAIRKADLFVQLFSEVDSLNGPKAQLKLAQTCRPIPIFQWRKKPPNSDLTILDEDDKKFCEGEYVRTGLLEHFKLALRDKLAELSKPQSEIALSDKPYLYITADTADLRLARQLQTVARKRTVADVMVEDEARRRNDFEEGLMHASGVIFLYGDAKRLFVDLWLKEFARKTRLLKLHPRIAALYLAPPERTEEEEPLVPIEGLRVEGSHKEFTLQGIERICAELCSDPIR
jgi:hypothetical protein